MKTILFSLAILLTIACTNEKKTEESAQDALRVELMAVHDDVMPKMGELTRIAGQLKAVLANDSTLTAEPRAELERAIDQMAVAEEGMMDWMAEFKQPESLRAQMDHAAIIKYLEQEKQTISTVADQINQGIETGKKLLEVHPSN